VAGGPRRGWGPSPREGPLRGREQGGGAALPREGARADRPRHRGKGRGRPRRGEQGRAPPRAGARAQGRNGGCVQGREGEGEGEREKKGGEGSSPRDPTPAITVSKT
jgi:hypothetical protein